jgi:TatD DNase family protein
LAELLERSKTRNVTPIIVTGTSIRSSEQAQSLCKEHPELLYHTAGVHPHDAKSCNEGTIERLRSLASDPSCVAIGECGLDFDRNFSEPKVQERWFVEQLKLAGELKKPVFLHERSASNRFIEILETNRDVIDLTTCVVHCFTGTTKELQTYLKMGMYIGITGWVTNTDKGASLRAAVKHIPLDRIMIETDAPFLAPRNGKDESNQSVRINRNEPELLHLVLQELADCMGITAQELAEASTENAHRFFAIPKPSAAEKKTEE